MPGPPLPAIHLGDIAQSKADAVIIPHSTNGFMTPGFKKITDELGLASSVPLKSELGDVRMVESIPATRIKYVLFACTNDSGQSNYSIIRLIMQRALKELDKVRMNTLACPLLGAGGAGLDGVKVCYLLDRVFEEGPDHFFMLDLYTLDSELVAKVKRAAGEYAKQTSLQLAFRFGIGALGRQTWVQEMTGMNEFYMAHALDAFQDYLNFTPPSPEFFSELQQEFAASDLVFQHFLRTLDPMSEKARFLTACGTLVAYIDRHAYNKQRWNAYDDKRTLALSSVKQTNWITNLLAFRTSAGDHRQLPPSIANAIRYLEQPEKELPMLSENHRQQVSSNLLQEIYVKIDFAASIYHFFQSLDLGCRNPQNAGILYCRLLYSPALKLLWQAEATPTSKVPKSTAYATDIADETAEDLRVRNLQALIHADTYAETDLLNYEIYASVIAAFLTSPFTKPPLTIGIMAPWGKGKTSLMHFISKKISGKAHPEKRPPVRETTSSTYADIWAWLGDFTKELLTIKTLPNPVVWFNAWKFQKNEQIWAGFAHEIINQLAEQISAADQEKFWFRLNVKRMDRAKLKRDIVFKFIQRAAWPLATLACSLLFSLLAKLYQFGTLSPVLGGAGILVSSLWASLIVRAKKLVKPDADISKYILQPEYENKRGYYTLVEEDLRHALEILADPEKPPVIFIDDLDRCSPTATAELLEAINLFVSGGISNCYFIIGQDAQMVAAALDAAYDNIGPKAANIDKYHGSLGWYFMEKFIQLQFNIPMLTNGQSARILQKLLSHSAEENGLDETRRQALLEQYEKLEEEIATIDNLDLVFTPAKEALEQDIALFAPEKIVLFQEKVIARAVGSYEVLEAELEEVLLDISPYLTSSPREVKRFANLFMFYQFLKYTESCKGLRTVNSATLGRWLMIMVRWPQLVRAIQWDTEKNFLSGATAAERARDFEQAVKGCESYESWLAATEGRTKSLATWQNDLQLYHFFRSAYDEEASLENAITAGLW